MIHYVGQASMSPRQLYESYSSVDREVNGKNAEELGMKTVNPSNSQAVVPLRLEARQAAQ